MMKFVNSMWKHLTRDKIERAAGINHAYKSDHSVFTAHADLDWKMKKMGNGIA
jgi:hypothetical protein